MNDLVPSEQFDFPKNITSPLDNYQAFIHLSRYARYLDKEKHRERWDQTVTRYMTFMVQHLKENFNYSTPLALQSELWNGIFNLEVMPSMRCLMTAGPALLRDNTCAYNCGYVAIDHQVVFDEALYILMCGTGLGFSVERENINKLPTVAESIYPTDTVIVVPDSKAGWAKSLKELIAMLYSGQEPKWDTTLIRDKGIRLKTMGGRSSGPEPLEELFKFVVQTFIHARGRKLTTLECHDLMCKIGEIVVVGGVRRSAMISLSDMDDNLMRRCKSPYDVVNFLYLDKSTESGKSKWLYTITYKDVDGVERSGKYWLNKDQLPDLHEKRQVGWFIIAPHRALANNSIVHKKRPTEIEFLSEWQALIESYSGERGIFNREAAEKTVLKSGRRSGGFQWGCNPCSEIILRPSQFCNLSEVVVRPGDDVTQLKRKVRLATILGTFQSTLTKFKYLRNIWKKNTEEERLLGVSQTGIMDNLISFSGDSLPCNLEELRELAISVNVEFADGIGIPRSSAISCNKPSGTVSQLVNASSGMHTRYARYFLRTVRQDVKDPITAFLIEQGIPYEPAEGREKDTVIFSFPMKSPEKSALRDDQTAIGQLKLWLIYQNHWCEHKPSMTVYVRDGEWIEVAAFVWKHFDEMSGVSFLPYDGGSYTQAPFQEIDRTTYEEALLKMPKNIDWESFTEETDNTTSSQEFACSGSSCEIVGSGQ